MNSYSRSHSINCSGWVSTTSADLEQQTIVRSSLVSVDVNNSLPHANKQSERLRFVARELLVGQVIVGSLDVRLVCVKELYYSCIQ